ncbi:MAG: coproporphyrinogen dehydrogenase HemZ [Peptostreptococcaceae bacterium]|jgi:oxygen-independent coproporphyrinogen-3 oxidase|nr:coproporphyrinogen dehydrogenase HemZ [Peptostreptococcaceae bacterium]
MIKVYLDKENFRYDVDSMLKIFTKEYKFLEEEKDVDISISFDQEKSLIKYYENKLIEIVIKKEDLIHLDMKKAVKKELYKILSNKFDKTQAWGILIGIRPTKIVHNLYNKGYDVNQIKDILKEEYLVSDEKIDLMIDICKKERKFLDFTNHNKVSVYISIPFCYTRCIYCSFPSHIISKWGHLTKNYMNALKKEIISISKYLKKLDKEIESIYIGGGTPSAISKEDIDFLLTTVENNFDLSKCKEFTFEAGRVDTLTEEKLRIIRKHKVDRISINPQTMNDETLKKINRKHDSKDICYWFKKAREIGFSNINMDIILGLIDEDVDMVKNTLEEIKKLNPESLTVHTLALKRASDLNKIDMDIEVLKYEDMKKMVDISMEFAGQMDMTPYYMYRQRQILGNLENIGYSKVNFESVYNIQIMEEKQSIIALGAGGISKIYYQKEDRLVRVPNVKDIEHYINRIDEMIKRKEDELFKEA